MINIFGGVSFKRASKDELHLKLGSRTYVLLEHDKENPSLDCWQEEI